jgi:elongation factor G
MSVEVIAPDDYTGTVTQSLCSRRGKINHMDKKAAASIVEATVPLSEMFGYMTELRSATQGRGSFTMEFSHYDKVPDSVMVRLGLK